MRVCLFCTAKVNSKEDAWPLWLVERFPSTGRARMFTERRGGQLSDWAMNKPKLPVKWVCKLCNNGWMSRMESKTKSIMESILDDKVNEMDSSGQSTLGVWAVKTAMVLEALDLDRERFYSAAEREQMRKSQSVPHHTSVWIAKCVSHKHIYSAAKNLSTTDGVRAFAVTMAFDFLAFQVVTVKKPNGIPTHVDVTYEVSDGPWDEILVPVWPVSKIPRKWPAAKGLNGDVGLNALTERLSPAMPRDKPG
jgi:hypothetical protein